jgi:hypothetical protein
MNNEIKKLKEELEMAKVAKEEALVIMIDVKKTMKEMLETIARHQEENKVLKEEINTLGDEIDGLEENLEDQVYDLQEERDDFRDKNEQLTDFAMMVHNQVFGTNFDDPDIVSSFCFDRIIEKMKEEEKDFWEKEERWTSVIGEKQERQWEVEKLKKVIKETKRAMGHSVSDTEEEEEEWENPNETEDGEIHGF